MELLGGELEPARGLFPARVVDDVRDPEAHVPEVGQKLAGLGDELVRRDVLATPAIGQESKRGTAAFHLSIPSANLQRGCVGPGASPRTNWIP